MLDQYITQGAVDSKSIDPGGDVRRGHALLDQDLRARRRSSKRPSGGKLQGLPYSVSAPILIYNQKAFTKAKLKTPPTTIAHDGAPDAAPSRRRRLRRRHDARRSTRGTCRSGRASATRYFVNHRTAVPARATAAAFNNAIGRSVFTDLQTIAKKGDARHNPSTGGIDTADANLYASGSTSPGMTIDELGDARARSSACCTSSRT